jgi:predicted RNase H-like nuclease
LAHLDGVHVMLEVYPHAALLELFRLPRIIKYKKGNVTRKRHGQQDLQHRIKELSLFSPPLETTPTLSNHLSIDTNSLRGAALKANEDLLDAIVCAYVAYYYWFWGSGGTYLFGDVEPGYIIVPKPLNNTPALTAM